MVPYDSSKGGALYKFRRAFDSLELRGGCNSMMGRYEPSIMECNVMLRPPPSHGYLVGACIRVPRQLGLPASKGLHLPAVTPDFDDRCSDRIHLFVKTSFVDDLRMDC